VDLILSRERGGGLKILKQQQLSSGVNIYREKGMGFVRSLLYASQITPSWKKSRGGTRGGFLVRIT